MPRVSSRMSFPLSPSGCRQVAGCHRSGCGSRDRGGHEERGGTLDDHATFGAAVGGEVDQEMAASGAARVGEDDFELEETFGAGVLQAHGLDGAAVGAVEREALEFE